MQEMRLTPDVAPTVKNYGAYELLQQLTPDLDEKLREHFPDIFREIRTVSLLRLVDSVTSAKMIQPMFLDSYMSDICSDIAVSEDSVRRFISRLGSMQGQLDTFMRSQVIPGTTLLFDGTSIFSRSADTLAVRLTLPTTKRVVDFHHQAIAHGGRTAATGQPFRIVRLFFRCL